MLSEIVENSRNQEESELVVLSDEDSPIQVIASN